MIKPFIIVRKSRDGMGNGTDQIHGLAEMSKIVSGSYGRRYNIETEVVDRRKVDPYFFGVSPHPTVSAY